MRNYNDNSDDDDINYSSKNQTDAVILDEGERLPSPKFNFTR
jgi:hypothetical protein